MKTRWRTIPASKARAGDQVKVPRKNGRGHWTVLVLRGDREFLQVRGGVASGNPWWVETKDVVSAHRCDGVAR
jgi:hypothetical protein